MKRPQTVIVTARSEVVEGMAHFVEYWDDEIVSFDFLGYNENILRIRLKNGEEHNFPLRFVAFWKRNALVDDNVRNNSNMPF